ncbi:hypothetical protein AMECASPLE_036139 [Ameca splendens]|uniref:Uncharacterized protein n=1 Tax=Ameca splendens TaxID=208324 RepID=A0ABV0ZSD7_9TELE
MDDVKVFTNEKSNEERQSDKPGLIPAAWIWGKNAPVSNIRGDTTPVPLGSYVYEGQNALEKIIKSEAMREDIVRQNALSVLHQRGGDVTDAPEVLGDYILQFGKYKGKSFRWLLEDYVGCIT